MWLFRRRISGGFVEPLAFRWRGCIFFHPAIMDNQYYKSIYLRYSPKAQFADAQIAN